MNQQRFLFTKITIFCIYLCAAYWISLHYPPLGMLFYPSLGSFSVILMGQGNYLRELVVIALGATITSAIGSLLYFWYPSIFTMFVTAFTTLWLMQKFSWRAAPILAVALIPFFSHPTTIWVLPLSVLCSVICLLLPLGLVQRLEKRRVADIKRGISQ
ncbi:hypothetical protein BEP19_00185 [Ammoniphilus oxalaticus]|uniref:HPP family protein n=1 Tax=Ammoniphilus oxalaticus TaxID=66863 RepID=A0A419SRH9_9BACL|nr:HPP family protein [Ammoniphilus oxalaticus]RKD27031.1 hypothetical protein BEP19_00185 [Ammoniphilus oxalaticus]